MTATDDLFADDPATRREGPQSLEVDLFDGAPSPQEQDRGAQARSISPAPELEMQQFPPEPQVQLAPRHAANHSGDPQWFPLSEHELLGPTETAAETDPPGANPPGDISPGNDEAEATVQLSGHDIRMKEFKRALVRGYSRPDVDGFLIQVIESFDACERVLMNAGRVPTAPATAPVEPVAPDAMQGPEQSMLILKHSQQAAEEALRNAEHSAEAIRAEAHTDAEQIRRSADQQARALHKATLQAARNDAERGLLRARDRARQVLEEAATREQQAARIEAEAELRLAHIEQRLAQKAKVVREQAIALDSLAAWLAEQDLRPEDPSVSGAAVAHATASAPQLGGDVLAFER